MGGKTFNKIRIKVWPFLEGEPTTLYWIDHPYQNSENQWVMDLYFKSKINRVIRKCTVPWGTLPILRIGRYYIDGELLSEKEEQNYRKNGENQIDTFQFLGSQMECVRGTYNIITIDRQKNLVAKNVFVGRNENLEIRIPVIEVIRAILAKNRKLLYAMLEPNGLDFYVLLERLSWNSNGIKLNFTREYPRSLLTKKEIAHIAWLCTNIDARRAWNEVYRSIIKSVDQGIYFTFPTSKQFAITAKYKKKNNIIRIDEILRFSGKVIPYEFIKVNSPHLHYVHRSAESKKNTLIRAKENDNLTIDMSGQGAKKEENIIELKIAEHQYNDMPLIDKERDGFIMQRAQEDENTEEKQIRRDNLYSTADIGGDNLLPGLEYRELDYIQDSYVGDIQEFINVLKAIGNMYSDINIRYIVENLPEGMKGKKFSKLDDGVARRRYVVAEIKTEEKKKVHLVEVERQGKSLSTLLIYCNSDDKKVRWEKVFQKILEGLVNNNGSWDPKQLKTLQEINVYNRRIRHTSRKNQIEKLIGRLYKQIQGSLF